jgi:hypothetical protein
MLWNSLLKSPMLVLGILMMGIFLYELKNPKTTPWFYRDKLIPSSCRNVEFQLNKHIPANWKLSCDNENLKIDIHKDMWDLKQAPEINQLKILMYRDLANNLKFIADHAPSESLSNVLIVRIEMGHARMHIAAITEGKFLAQLKNLKTSDFIRDHLKSTVSIKEFIK